MESITRQLNKLYKPSPDSHKGQNGKLLLIGGSKLFHAASLWALKTASFIVDLVHYASTEENNQIVKEIKKQFQDGIVISRAEIDDYIKEDDCILIGPGMERDSETRNLTEKLLNKYPQKKWVIDAGALQILDKKWIPKKAILTPHRREFEQLFETSVNLSNVGQMAKKYDCILLVKGEKDIICSSDTCQIITGGNPGMTKGGTGDVLAGLTASFYCKNEAFLSAVCASYINKKAGDELFKRVGYFFNASNLTAEIPRVMKKLILGLESSQKDSLL